MDIKLPGDGLGKRSVSLVTFPKPLLNCFVQQMLSNVQISPKTQLLKAQGR